MANKKLYTEQYVEDIADSIRSVLGTTRTYKISEMALEISSKMKAKSKYTITTTVTSGTYTGDTEIYEGSTAAVTITATSPATLPDTITVTGATYTWDKTSGVISLSNPTANVIITVTCKSPEWWDDVSSLTSADIGLEKDITVNGITQKVRLIGVDHDDKADGTGKAHTTWQFVKILSDANGYSLSTLWKDTSTSSGSNYDFINSDIRKALDGQGTGTANWFVKSGTTWESTLSGKSVLDMLPANLVSKLQTVTKKVATTSSYTVNSYSTNLFIPSCTEMTATLPTYAVAGEGTLYSYWSTHDSSADRIIQQINGSSGAITSGTAVTSGAYSGTKYSYAGYNNSTSTNGGIVWLRSPDFNSSYAAYDVSSRGNFSNISVCRNAYGVAPCFCL